MGVFFAHWTVAPNNLSRAGRDPANRRAAALVPWGGRQIDVRPRGPRQGGCSQFVAIWLWIRVRGTKESEVANGGFARHRAIGQGGTPQ